MSVKYQKLPMEETEARIDFSSPFSFEKKNTTNEYRSIFTYDNKHGQNMNAFKLQFNQVSFTTRLGHWVILGASFLIFLLTIPISIWLSFKIVPEHKRLVVFRLGWMLKAKGPGIVFVLPMIDRHHFVDIRTRAFNVPPQQLLTADGAAIEVGADVYLRIIDVQKSVTCVQDLNHSTRLLVQMALVKQLTKRSLDEIEKEKTAIVNSVQDDCREVSTSWGIEISRCELSLVKVLAAPSTSKVPLPKCLSFSEDSKSSLPGIPTPLKQLSLALLNGNFSKGKVNSHQIKPSRSEDATEKMKEPKRILSLLESVLSEDLVKTIQTIYQINIGSETTAFSTTSFILDLKNGCGDVREGTSGMVDACLTVEIEDLFEMIHGRLKPLAAYMNGRLKVSGNVKSALKLEPLLLKLRTAL